MLAYTYTYRYTYIWVCVYIYIWHKCLLRVSSLMQNGHIKCYLSNTKLLLLPYLTLRYKLGPSRVLFISINGKSILPQPQAPKPQGYPYLLCFSHSPWVNPGRFLKKYSESEHIILSLQTKPPSSFAWIEEVT